MVGNIGRRALMLTSVGGAAAGVAVAARRARAQQAPTIRIGVLTSLSGPYTAVAGPGSVLAARMAVADFTRDTNRASGSRSWKATSATASTSA
jgi:branched-chain amino acid transport system substrate-binding protein